MEGKRSVIGHKKPTGCSKIVAQWSPTFPPVNRAMFLSLTIALLVRPGPIYTIRSYPVICNTICTNYERIFLARRRCWGERRHQATQMSSGSTTRRQTCRPGWRGRWRWRRRWRVRVSSVSADHCLAQICTKPEKELIFKKSSMNIY